MNKEFQKPKKNLLLAKLITRERKKDDFYERNVKTFLIILTCRVTQFTQVKSNNNGAHIP